MLENHYLDDFINFTLNIWSDRGRKHFKLSSNIYNFMNFVERYRQFIWEYNFFASYHGHGICDTVAAQGKRELNIFQRTYNLAFQHEGEIIEVSTTN